MSSQPNHYATEAHVNGRLWKAWNSLQSSFTGSNWIQLIRLIRQINCKIGKTELCRQKIQEWWHYDVRSSCSWLHFTEPGWHRPWSNSVQCTFNYCTQFQQKADFLSLAKSINTFCIHFTWSERALPVSVMFSAHSFPLSRECYSHHFVWTHQTPGHTFHHISAIRCTH